MYNKRVLTKAVNELDTPKAPVRKNSNAKIVTNSTPIISSEGYKQGPPPEGTHYRILGNKLYNPTPYPITAVSDNGITKTLQPYDETNVDFPGASYVDEFTAKKGGSLPNIPKKKNSKGYSRSLEATNKLFAQNPLTKKPKSRKRKIFDPNSKYYQIGGEAAYIDLDLTDEEIEVCRAGGYVVEELPKAQTGKSVKPYITSDINDFRLRQAAYNDSLSRAQLSHYMMNYADALIAAKTQDQKKKVVQKFLQDREKNKYFEEAQGAFKRHPDWKGKDISSRYKKSWYDFTTAEDDLRLDNAHAIPYKGDLFVGLNEYPDELFPFPKQRVILKESDIPPTTTTPVPNVVVKEYIPNLNTDLAAWLKTQKAPASYADRKKLYEQATGKTDYKGTAEQNIGLLKLLKQEGLDYKANNQEVAKSVELPQDSQLIELPTKPLTPIKPDTIKVPSMQLKWFQTPTGTWYQDYVPEELDYDINTGSYKKLGGLTQAQTGIQKGVACDTDRCEETDKIQEILDDRDRAITDSLKIDNRIAEQVWNEDVSAEKLFNQIGIKSANQQLNTLAPNCSNYGTGSLRCIDPSINTEHTLSNYRFNKAVKENKTPFELVGTYKGVGNIPPEILQRGDLVSELYDGHGHMIKYTGTNNGEPAYLHSTGSKDSWERVDSPEDWMTHTTHVYRYHPDEMDKIPMLEEMARTNPTYYIPGKMPLRPAENISQNNLNTLDLGNTTFKYGGLPKAQSGLYKLTQSLLKPFSRTTTNLETLQLPKLPQLELELPELTLPGYRMTDLEKVLNKAAPHYVNRATDPRNFERAAALDAEYGTNYVQGLKELQRHLDETSNIGELPLNIKIEKDPDDGSGGYSDWTEKGKLKRLLGYPTNIRDRKIVLYDNTDPSDVRRILPHEGKHHYTMAIPDFYSNAWGDFMSSTLEPLTEINKTNPAFADKLIKPAFKGADYSKYEYFEKPQEIDAYINTNLRDQLVDEGILEHHWDTLDDSKVAEFLMSNPEKHSKAYLDLLKSKDFINMFNKGVYAIPAAIGVGAMSQDYKAGGEYKLGDTVDKAKMRELEKLGYTLEKVK